jgi:hypothetical protein
MDGTGTSVTSVDWDPSLSPGKYWLVTPATIPKESKVPDFGNNPVLWAVYFFVDYSPDYDADALASSTQNIFLRPSCGSEMNVQADKVYNLQYGPWGANGLDLLNATKDKVITRLFVNDEEVVGYRPDEVMTMSQVPCGSFIENAYYLYNEAQIGPFYLWNGEQEINIRVEYSFVDTITDGYDLSPQDGQNDLYSPTTSFSQTYKLIVVP